MMRVCIVCEGATEANFVKECLSPHLADRGVYVYASILQAPSGNHKGGRVTVEQAALQSIRQAVQSPEEINDSPMTAPSKRLERIFGRGIYSKPEHGPIIAQEIGLDAIRSQCPQFDTWVRHLENWGQA